MFLALVALTALLPARAARIDRYVDKASPNPASPYDSWANAATNIQAAIDAAVATEGDQVIVRAGVYDTGGFYYNGHTNRVYIGKAITVRSEHDEPSATSIQGQWEPGGNLGPNAVRCVYIESSGARLSGFTLTNGATQVGGLGGGVVGRGGSIVSNCIVTGNVADQGGGVASTSITAPYMQVYDCVITNNTAVLRGGGTHFVNLYNSDVVWNYCNNSVEAGGVRSGFTYNSRILYNRGAGALYSRTYNCLIAGNTYMGIGGPAEAYNCTVVGNNNVGIYMHESHSVRSVFNCISRDNRSLDHTYGGCATNSLGVPGPDNTYTNTAVGNLTLDPQFVQDGDSSSGWGRDYVLGDYHLRGTSPARNAGLIMDWMQDIATDLDGNPRIDRMTGAVDMGCYEIVYRGTYLLVR